MEERKNISRWIIIVNVIGIICLIYYAIPYLTHDTTVMNSDAMIPFEEWDRDGWILTFGCIPLLCANIIAVRFVKTKRNWTRFLFLIPGVICFALVISYWITSLL